MAKAGTKLNKQNVFDDFIAAAEHLIDEGYTQPSKLAIQGGSNGGRWCGGDSAPRLFGAAIPAVGVLDMLRYHKFTIGWAWADDYGTSEESPEMFNYLKGYPAAQPQGRHGYPTTMVVTADHDDVVPAHSYKFAAEPSAPTGATTRFDSNRDPSWHGGGTPISKRSSRWPISMPSRVRALRMDDTEDVEMEEAAKQTRSVGASNAEARPVDAVHAVDAVVEEGCGAVGKLDQRPEAVDEEVLLNLATRATHAPAGEGLALADAHEGVDILRHTARIQAL